MSESIPPGTEGSKLLDSCVDSELADRYMSEKTYKNHGLISEKCFSEI